MTTKTHQHKPRQTEYEVMTPEELRDIRLKLGWTQDEARKKLELSLRGYKQYELGERPIPGPVKLLMRIYLKENT